mmetsp:Transcript_6458/g.29129  ORF Transcript_6458/g.29129 Transcript_6458/m.29129 type:complete len:262 (-) Transcript_6458:1720-2505(-)
MHPMRARCETPTLWSTPMIATGAMIMVISKLKGNDGNSVSRPDTYISSNVRYPAVATHTKMRKHAASNPALTCLWNWNTPMIATGAMIISDPNGNDGNSVLLYNSSIVRYPAVIAHTKMRTKAASSPAFTAGAVISSARDLKTSSTTGSSKRINPRVFHGVWHTKGSSPFVSLSLSAETETTSWRYSASATSLHISDAAPLEASAATRLSPMGESFNTAPPSPVPRCCPFPDSKPRHRIVASTDSASGNASHTCAGPLVSE